MIGDLNFRFNLREASTVKGIKTVFGENGFKQLINVPIQVSGNTGLFHLITMTL